MARNYHITLWDSDHVYIPLRRVVFRDDDAGGIESAVRALRLHRNVHRATTPIYDRWTVGVVDVARGFTILATGGTDDENRLPTPGRGLRPETVASADTDSAGDDNAPPRDGDLHPDRT